jgi:ubiquinone/menaquinone biosynthesis C-methylase UbiE
MQPEGVLDSAYHVKRTIKRSHAYRLKRRTLEVVKVIDAYFPGSSNRLKILDAGTADGLMLSDIKTHYPQSLCIGLEYAEDLIKTNEDDRLTMLRGDAAALPFQEDSFDLLTACAIIEHLPDADRFIRESFRVLKRNGILIVTTPVPFWEKMLTKTGNLDDDQHYCTYNLNRLTGIFKKGKFKILKGEKFMMSPIGFPFELFFERIMKAVHFTITLGNQIVVGQK